MRVWALVLLTAASVWGFPQRRAEEKQPDLPQIVHQIQEKNINKAREIQRDCKGKCAANIAQKAAAEAKAAQQAQNAAGAQAAHMVSTLLKFNYQRMSKKIFILFDGVSVYYLYRLL